MSTAAWVSNSSELSTSTGAAESFSERGACRVPTTMDSSIMYTSSV